MAFLTEPPDAPRLEARLAEVGLTGPQLELKRTGFRRALDRFRETVTKPRLRRVLG
jgi:hypothetical protein